MPNSKPLEIDIEKVITSKNHRLAKLLPKALIIYLKRIIHQDDINYVLSNFAHLPAIDFARATLEYMGVSYTSIGIDRLNTKGRYLFASNHPFGGIDGMMLCDELHSYFGSGRVVSNDILMNITPLNSLFIPINKHGRQNASYLRDFRAAMNSNEQVGTFPAGLVSRRRKGVVKDLAWKSSFVRNAIDSGRDIVPVYFEGRLSSFFYNLANLRTTMSIKVNIEMLFLVDEMFKQRDHHFNIIFGEPITCEQLKAEGSSAEWAERIRTTVYQLKDMPKL